jgi:Lon-like ATP-dependent protease
MSLPQNLNTYKFLVDANRHDFQKVYETTSLEDRLQGMNALFSEFANKIEVWTKLEQQYDFKSDQQKTQKKLEEIYTSLKENFNQGKDEKQEAAKTILDNLKDKVVPEHIMKVINEEMQRFIEMPKEHSEYAVLKTYLEYLTKLPYGISSEENFDLK